MDINAALKEILRDIFEVASREPVRIIPTDTLIRELIDELRFTAVFKEPEILEQFKAFLLSEPYFEQVARIDVAFRMGVLPRITDFDFIDDFRYIPGQV